MKLGAFLRAVWDGPFQAGPIVRPASVGDALLRLFQTIWRVIVAVAVAVVVTGLALWLYISLQPKPLGQRLIVTTVAKSPACDAAMPIGVSIRNPTSERVSSFYIDMKAYERGWSDDISTTGGQDLARIIEPGGTSVMCWRIPMLSRTPEGPVSYQAVIDYATATN